MYEKYSIINDAAPLFSFCTIYPSFILKQLPRKTGLQGRVVSTSTFLLKRSLALRFNSPQGNERGCAGLLLRRTLQPFLFYCHLREPKLFFPGRAPATGAHQAFSLFQ